MVLIFTIIAVRCRESVMTEYVKHKIHNRITVETPTYPCSTQAAENNDEVRR